MWPAGSAWPSQPFEGDVNKKEVPLGPGVKYFEDNEGPCSHKTFDPIIKHDEFSETLKIAGMLISDKEDLIHKTVGWMLREVGKRLCRPAAFP